MKKRTKAILRIVLLALTALIVGINLYSLNASHLAGDTVPMPFGIGATVVLSGSMEPTLSKGDLLIVSKQDSYEIDDVVVYQSGRISIVHRIVEIDGENVITRGDANGADDEPIPYERIKGGVVFAIPLVGYAVNVIKTPIGTFVLLALAVFLLERSFHREKAKDDEELEKLKAEIRTLIEAQKKELNEAPAAEDPEPREAEEKESEIKEEPSE